MTCKRGNPSASFLCVSAHKNHTAVKRNNSAPLPVFVVLNFARICLKDALCTRSLQENAAKKKCSGKPKYYRRQSSWLTIIKFSMHTRRTKLTFWLECGGCHKFETFGSRVFGGNCARVVRLTAVNIRTVLNCSKSYSQLSIL